MKSKQLNNICILARNGLASAAEVEAGETMAELWQDWTACAVMANQMKAAELEAEKATKNGDTGDASKEG